MARVIRYVLEKTAGIMVIHKYMHHCKPLCMQQSISVLKLL